MSRSMKQSSTSPRGDEKFDFDSLYNQADPRPYFDALSTLGYQIPQQALPILRRVLEASSKTDHAPAMPRKVLDVCCSYGINSTLLKCDINMDSVAQYYRESADLPPNERIAVDRQYFAERILHSDLEIIGLDVASQAVHYGVATGLLASGWVENLEIQAPSKQLCAELWDVSLVICTGGVGYVGPNTFERIAASVANPADLWVVSFVLRTFDYRKISAALDEYGLATEKVPDAVFRQRQFATLHEQRWAIAEVVSRGLDPTGLESDGFLYADCYITRPRGECCRTPITSLCPGFEV